MTLIRRNIIIRQQDLPALIKKTIRTGLYDSVDIEPVTRKSIQQQYLIDILAGRAVPSHRQFPPDLQEDLEYCRPRLYNARYLEWTLSVDYPDGQIYVQSSGPRQSPSALFSVTLEKEHARESNDSKH